ncbi:hypothetical protein ACIBEJ_45040 [Nonomuraea sp. NPDC050790]|uniref:hypothetical protein n=1 Tax=Nonomuraea sp. NPDC050790 TaxID=3364371 RepID=UPI0037B5BA09
MKDRLLAAARPVCQRYALALVGGDASRAHGLTEHSVEILRLATAADVPLYDVTDAVVRAFEEAGLEARVAEAGPRAALLEVGCLPEVEPVEVELLKEALQEPPVELGGVLVAALPDVAGLRMRDLHERGLPADILDVAAVSHLYGFRELEALGRVHTEDFSTGELLMRLEFVDSMDFAGVAEERVDEIRRFAEAWVEDIKLRRAEEGDIDVDVPDLPSLD